jgi:hypothetical protein
MALTTYDVKYIHVLHGHLGLIGDHIAACGSRERGPVP